MNDKEKLQQQEDKEIRDLLIQESIIDDHRVVRCGHFSNYERYKPYPTFCKRYQCRVCRRKLIDTQRKKHYSNNIEFINRDGTVIMLTLTVPHTVKDKLSSLHDRFQKSLSNMKHSRSWRKIKDLTNCQFHYNNIELTERKNGYHLHNHIVLLQMELEKSIA